MGGRMMSMETPYMLPARGKKRGRKRKPGRRGNGGAGVYPALKNIGVIHGVTPGLREDVTLSALNNTFDEASDSLKRRGIDISAKRVRAVSEKFAATTLEIRQKDLDDYRNGAAAQAPVLRGARVAVCLDGGRINIRTPKNGRIPADAKRRGFNSNWREPKLFTIYSLDEEGKRLKGAPRFCDGTISGPEKTLDLLAAELHRLGIGGAKELVFISDGAPWIWNRLDAFIGAIGFPAENVVKVLDFCHAVGHLAVIADLLPGRSGKQKKRWLKKMKTLLKEASPDDFLAELSRAIGKTRVKKLRTEFNYFAKNKNHIAYADFIARHIPIGSGSVESAIRRVVNLRLKGAGMFWLKENAEGFLHLRCQTKSGNWDSFFQRALRFMSGGV